MKVNEVDKGGNSALHHTCIHQACNRQGHERCIQELIAKRKEGKNRINLDLPDRNGLTPLHQAEWFTFEFAGLLQLFFVVFRNRNLCPKEGPLFNPHVLLLAAFGHLPTLYRNFPFSSSIHYLLLSCYFVKFFWIGSGIPKSFNLIRHMIFFSFLWSIYRDCPGQGPSRKDVRGREEGGLPKTDVI